MAEDKYSAEALLAKEKEVELDTDDVKEEIIKKELINLSFKKKKLNEEKRQLLILQKVCKRNLTKAL